MVKKTLWTVGLSLAVLTTISCKKKTEDPVPENPEVPSKETPLVFRPIKVYMGNDSSNLKIYAEYAYDELGRVKQRIFYNDNPQTYIDQLKETWTYTPSVTYVKRAFLNHEDQKFYTAGYDSMYIENNRIKRKASFYMYHHSAVIGNDTVGVKTSSTYTYKDGDSLEIYIYRNIAYDSKMETAHYTYNKKGELVKYESVKEGEESSSFFFTVLSYADIKGRFQEGSAPIGTEDYKGLPTEIKTEIPSTYVSTAYTKWSFDSNKRPISSIYTTKTGTDSTQTFYRFEY